MQQVCKRTRTHTRMCRPSSTHLHTHTPYNMRALRWIRVQWACPCTARAGFEVTRGLMAQGAHVVMACRNGQLCGEAASQLRALGLPGRCECRHLDLLDHASIRSFVQQLERGSPFKEPRCCGGTCAGKAPIRNVHVLVNNAGKLTMWPGRPPHNAAHAGPLKWCGRMPPCVAHVAVVARRGDGCCARS